MADKGQTYGGQETHTSNEEDILGAFTLQLSVDWVVISVENGKILVLFLFFPYILVIFHKIISIFALPFDEKKGKKEIYN